MITNDIKIGNGFKIDVRDFAETAKDFLCEPSNYDREDFANIIIEIVKRKCWRNEGDLLCMIVSNLDRLQKDNYGE